MSGDTSDDVVAPDFVEVDPSGRYGRYSEVLGKGASKLVYRAFDELEGIEVAWNQVKVKDVARSSEDLERFHSELHLLKTLKHKNIIKFYGSWVDTKHGNINFITEIFTSGNLRQYRKKHKHVDIKAMKNWSRQILEGLVYLHNYDPPVIHRDVKCDNIFINGSHGEVKIGDLGLAAILRHAHLAHTIIGTPEFMAPEFYEEEYNELVDIYAFGMCLLELVTLEYPYAECTSPAQIFRNVTLGIKPESLAKVKDSEVKRFIEKCITKASDRLSASELLMDPFLQLDDGKGCIPHPMRSHSSCPDQRPPSLDTQASSSDANADPSSKDFVVEEQQEDIKKIVVKLRVADYTGHVKNIHFQFDVENDTTMSVASEMVEELGLGDENIPTIAMMIDSEIQHHVPHWVSHNFSTSQYNHEDLTAEAFKLEAEDEVPALPDISDNPSGSFMLERLPSGRKYWSDSPKGSPSRTLQSSVLSESDRNFTDRAPSEIPESEDSRVNGISEHNHLNLRNGSIPGCIPESAKLVLEKLESLLEEQQKELHELKKKHEEAVADILKDLQPELCSTMLSRWRLKAHKYNS